MKRPAEDPCAEGYRFDGWYTDTAYATPWNFETMLITEPTTIYAKWVQTTYTLKSVNDAKKVEAAFGVDSQYDTVIVDIGEDQVWNTSTITVPEGKTLILESGTIAPEAGYGVENSSTFVMNDGKIQATNAGYSCFYGVENYGTFVMSGGKIQATHEVTDGFYGCGIFCKLNSSTTITGGEIEASTDAITTASSGAVCNITITGGVIKGGNAALNLECNTAETEPITICGACELSGAYGITSGKSSNSNISIEGGCILGTTCAINVRGNTGSLTISAGTIQSSASLIDADISWEDSGIISNAEICGPAELIYNCTSDAMPETGMLPYDLPISNGAVLKCPVFDVVFDFVYNYEITQTTAPTEKNPYYAFTFGKPGTVWTVVNPDEMTLNRLSEMKLDGILNIYDLDLSDGFGVMENRELNLMGNCTLRKGATMSIFGTCTVEPGAVLTIEPDAVLTIEGAYGDATGGTCTISDGATLNNNGTINVGNDDFPNATLNNNGTIYVYPNATLNGEVNGNDPASPPTEET